MKKNNIFTTLFLTVCISSNAANTNHNLWSIGDNDNSAKEFALAPENYKQFLAHDFGYEDRYFLINTSTLKSDFPYVLPGPDDTWGGTWGTSGWRTHDVNILFNLEKVQRGSWKLILDLVDSAPTRSVIKINT